MLSDDFCSVLLAGEKKGANGRRNDGCDLRNAVFANDSRTAGHLRNEPNGGSTACNCQFRLFYALDATDFYPVLEDGPHLELLAVWNPDVLYLGGMFEKPTALALLHIEPINRSAFVGKHLLEVSH